MRQRLAAPEESGKPIRVSIIGCGRFGSMMVAQIKRDPGMTVSVVCDADGQRDGNPEAVHHGQYALDWHALRSH